MVLQYRAAMKIASNPRSFQLGIIPTKRLRGDYLRSGGCYRFTLEQGYNFPRYIKLEDATCTDDELKQDTIVRRALQWLNCRASTETFLLQHAPHYLSSGPIRSLDS